MNASFDRLKPAKEATVDRIRSLRMFAMAVLLLAPLSAVAANCGGPGIGTLYSVVRVLGSHGVAASGVVIDAGWVLTVAHVIEADSKLRVASASRDPRPARLRSINVSMDLALLAVDTSGMTPVAIESDGLRFGEAVWAAGYPRNGELTTSRGHYQQDRGGRLQTDAFIDSGQSGGALFICRKGLYELAGIVHGYLALSNGSTATNTGQSSTLR